MKHSNWPTRWFAVPAAALVLTMILPGPCRAANWKTAKPVPYRFYGFVNLGPFDGEENLGLLGGASEQFVFAGGFGHRLASHVWGEAELGVAGRDHTVVPGVLPPGIDDPTLSIAWLSYSIVLRFTAGRVEPFVAFGIGPGEAELQVVSDQPFAPPELQIDSDKGLLVQYRVGFDVAVSRKSRIGLDLRKITFDADLGAFTNGETDIGGTAALLTYRYIFGHNK